MSENLFKTSTNPSIYVKGYGKLSIKGWDRPEIRHESLNGEEVSIEGDENTVHISSMSGCVLAVPEGSVLYVEEAFGKAIINNITGHIIIQQSTDDLHIRNAGKITVQKAFGPLDITAVSGDLEINSATGTCSIEALAGNLNAKTTGVATFSLQPKPEYTYKIESIGPLTLLFPEDLNATLDISAKGPASVNLGETSEKFASKKRTLIFGEGEAKVTINAIGPVVVKSQPEGKRFKSKIVIDLNDLDELPGKLSAIAGDFTDQINEKVNVQMEMLGMQLDQMSRLSDLPGLSPERIEEITRRAEERADSVRAKIEKAAQKAQARTSRKIASAQRRAEKQAHKEAQKARSKQSFSWKFGDADTKSSDPVSDEERLLILKMLAEQKISSEEADKLLAAIEGK